LFICVAKCNFSVFNIPFQCLKIQFFKSLKAIEVMIELISNETIIDETVLDSHDILLKENSHRLVQRKHKFVSFLMVNKHHDFEIEKFVTSKLSKRESTN